MNTRIKEITVKGIITKSKLPDANYVINPYTGCEFGCAYCYASFMGRFVNEPIEGWGAYVYVKTNAVELFKQEASKVAAEGSETVVLLSSVTDAYQGVESKYCLTKGILQAAVQTRFPALISILTKSALVERDIEILTQLPRVEVGLTVTTTDDAISRFLEVRASSASRRIMTLRKLNEAGLPTYAFVGPLLPHFVYRADELEKVFKAIAEAGTKEVYVEHMNLAKYIRTRLNEVLKTESDEVRAVYKFAAEEEHHEKLRNVVNNLIQRYNLKLRLGQTIEHGKSDGLKGRNTSHQNSIAAN